MSNYSNPITSWLQSAQVNENVIDGERTVIGVVLNWVRLIGTGLALIMLTYMSLRYFMAAGPHDKAELKKRLINFAIGVTIFIAASNLIYFVEQIAESVIDASLN